LNKLELRVQKVLSYLESDIGKNNWLLNVSRGYSYYQNLFAAIMTAAHLIKYENIIEVYDAVNLVWDVTSIRGAA